MLGSISGDSTHIALRVSLRAELPIVNSAATDPTIPETIIPWILTSIQDDRVQGYTLARRIYTDLGLKRIGLLRVNERYGRFGVLKVPRRLAPPRPSRGDRAEVRAAGNRLHAPVARHQRFRRGWHRALGRCRRRRHHPQTDARNGHEAAGLRQLPAWWATTCCASPARRPKDWKSSTRSIPLATIPPGSISSNASPPPITPTVEVVLRARLRHHEHSAPVHLPRRPEPRPHPRRAVFARKLQGRHRRDDFRSQRQEHRAAVPGQGEGRQNHVPPLHHGEAVRDGRRRPWATPGRRWPMPPARSSASACSAPARKGSPPRWTHPATASPACLRTSPGAKLPRTSSNWSTTPRFSALIATDRNSAHLAEQIAVKTFLPVIAISSDRTLTSANVPWIFRLPTGTSPADAVRCLAAAARQAGPNRGKIRDMLASGKPVWGQVSFHASGEPQ